MYYKQTIKRQDLKRYTFHNPTVCKLMLYILLYTIEWLFLLRLMTFENNNFYIPYSSYGSYAVFSIGI